MYTLINILLHPFHGIASNIQSGGLGQLWSFSSVFVDFLYQGSRSICTNLGEPSQISDVEAHSDNRVALSLLALVYDTRDRFITSGIHLVTYNQLLRCLGNSGLKEHTPCL